MVWYAQPSKKYGEAQIQYKWIGTLLGLGTCLWSWGSDNEFASPRTWGLILVVGAAIKFSYLHSASYWVHKFRNVPNKFSLCIKKIWDYFTNYAYHSCHKWRRANKLSPYIILGWWLNCSWIISQTIHCIQVSWLRWFSGWIISYFSFILPK